MNGSPTILMVETNATAPPLPSDVVFGIDGDPNVTTVAASRQHGSTSTLIMMEGMVHLHM